VLLWNCLSIAQLKPNSITLGSSKLALNMFGAGSEPTSVMEFGFHCVLCLYELEGRSQAVGRAETTTAMSAALLPTQRVIQFAGEPYNVVVNSSVFVPFLSLVKFHAKQSVMCTSVV